MKAFISYSHRDSPFLERLHTHLATLKREGKVKAWYDRDILAGGEINAEISGQLESCELFLALVSPDFLASNYCYEQEMQKAIELHDAGKSRIISIIVEPCDWQSTPLKRFKAVPRDGKPVSEWQNHNTAFLDVVTELRRIAESEGEPKNMTISQQPPNDSIRPKETRRYRTKRTFDEIDRADFRNTAFRTIKKYIQSSIAEIDGIENIKARFSDVASQSFSCTILNKVREQGLGSLTVHMQSDNIGFGDIYYSNSENARVNTANGGFRIEADDYDLFLTDGFSSSNSNQRLTATQAAEILWKNLLERAGISYA